MRALELTAFDGPAALRLVEAPEPQAGDCEVLLDIEAIGINFPDLLATQGLYQHKPPLPFIPGCEVAGVVRSAAAGSGWSPGDRAAAFVWQGGYAERVAVPLNALMAVPDGIEITTAAAMVVNYHTAHFGLSRRGRLQAGETALIMGAGGGIGTAGLQVARGLEARAIGGVADGAQRETALAAGAEHVVVLSEGFAAAVRELTGGRGVDLVLDPLGGWLFDEALRALAPEGRILVIGFAAGEISNLKVNRLLLRNASAVGVAWGAFLDVDPRIMSTASEELRAMLESGIVRPQIGSRFAFEEVPQALEALSRGAIRGKAVAEVPRSAEVPR